MVAVDAFRSDTEPPAEIISRTVGYVSDIDGDGDADIFFGPPFGRQWVSSADFSKLRAVVNLDFEVTSAMQVSVFHRSVLLEYDGLSLEESRWQFYKARSEKEDLLNRASVPEPRLLKGICFELMSAGELQSCKRFIPVEQYASCLEVACGLRPPGDPQRQVSARLFNGIDRCMLQEPQRRDEVLRQAPLWRVHRDSPGVQGLRLQSQGPLHDVPLVPQSYMQERGAPTLCVLRRCALE